MTAVKYYSEAGKKAFVSISQEDYQSQGGFRDLSCLLDKVHSEKKGRWKDSTI